MLVLHHLENSRSQRILWLLEELGVPYEIKRYARDKKTMFAPPELKAVHPLGKSPVVTDGDVTVAETGAIVEYLLDTYDREGKLRPAKDTPEYRRFVYWLHYAEGSAMPPLLIKLVFDMVPKQSPALVRPLLNAVSKKVNEAFVGPQLKTHFDFWEAELAPTGWFAGAEFSAADVAMSFPLETAADRAGAGGRPGVRKFLHKVRARPAYKRALEKGGPYAYADK